MMKIKTVGDSYALISGAADPGGATIIFAAGKNANESLPVCDTEKAPKQRIPG